jgi:monothiol glutaredoxin
MIGTIMSEVNINDKITSEINSSKVFLFMKGTPKEPMGGFSAQVIQVLNSYGLDFKTFNVLDDWDVREGIKSFSNWPTIPQIYVGGKFLGGCDIAMEMHRKGELETALKS